MPIYEFEDTDGSRIEKYYKTWRACPETLEWAGRTWSLAISVPAMQPDKYWNGYYDESLGMHISSRKQHREAMKACNAGTPGSDQWSKEHRRQLGNTRDKKLGQKRRDNIGETVRDIMI